MNVFAKKVIKIPSSVYKVLAGWAPGGGPALARPYMNTYRCHNINPYIVSEHDFKMVYLCEFSMFVYGRKDRKSVV